MRTVMEAKGADYPDQRMSHQNYAVEFPAALCNLLHWHTNTQLCRIQNSAHEKYRCQRDGARAVVSATLPV